MVKKQVRNTIIRVVCTALIFLLIVAFSDLVWVVLNAINSPERLTDDLLSPEAFGIVFLCCFVFVFYSFSHLAISYDRVLREASALEKNRLSNRMKKVVSLPSFWCELAIVLLLLFALPGGFFRVTGVYRIAAYPAVGIAFFLAHIAVVARWNIKNEKREKTGPFGIVKAVCVRILIFLVGALALPPVLGLAYSYLRLLSLFWNVAFFVSLGALILGLILFKYLRAVTKRKKLLKRLAKICEEKQYSLYCGKVYRSILFANEDPEITIRTGETTYECKLFSAWSKKTPLYLLKTGEAVADRAFRIGRVVLFHHMVSTRYAFEAEGKKFLILVPAPIFVYGTDGGRRSDLYDSARVGDYTIFSSAAFLHALDLDALDETDRKREW